MEAFKKNIELFVNDLKSAECVVFKLGSCDTMSVARNIKSDKVRHIGYNRSKCADVHITNDNIDFYIELGEKLKNV